MTGTAINTPPQSQSQQLERVIENGNILNLLPKGFDVNKYKQGLFHAIEKLGIKDMNELQGILMPVAELAKDGLLPDGKEAALVPYGKMKVGNATVKRYTPIRMVKGALKMAWNGGITNWHVALYHENDVLEYDAANPQNTKFIPEWKGDQGKIMGYIGIAWLPDGSKNVCIMPLAKILERRAGVFARFKEYTAFGETKTVADQIAASTWTQHPEEMMIKTGIHYQMKRLPLSESPRLREVGKEEDERYMKDVTPKSAPPKALPPKKPATPPAQTATKSDQESKTPAKPPRTATTGGQAVVEGEVVDGGGNGARAPASPPQANQGGGGGDGDPRPAPPPFDPSA